MRHGKRLTFDWFSVTVVLSILAKSVCMYSEAVLFIVGPSLSRSHKLAERVSATNHADSLGHRISKRDAISPDFKVSHLFGSQWIQLKVRHDAIGKLRRPSHVVVASCMRLPDPTPLASRRYCEVGNLATPPIALKQKQNAVVVCSQCDRESDNWRVGSPDELETSLPVNQPGHIIPEIPSVNLVRKGLDTIYRCHDTFFDTGRVVDRATRGCDPLAA